MKVIGITGSIVALILLTVAAGGYLSVSFAADVVVIVNKGVDTEGVTEKDIKNIFLGKKTKWSNNEKITFIIQKGTEEHRAFLKKYVGKTESQFRSFWKKMVFTGKGKAPKFVKNSDDVIAFVSSKDNSIGYISPGSKSDQVKVIGR